jgi:hypothetical protein
MTEDELLATTGSEAIDGLLLLVGRLGVPAPYLPEALRPQIRHVDHFAWGTDVFDPMEHYFHRNVDTLMDSDEDRPLWLCSWAGHGEMSYAWSLTCRLGPLAVAVEAWWPDWWPRGGQFEAATELALAFTLARLLIERAEGLEPPCRIVVDYAPFRGRPRIFWRHPDGSKVFREVRDAWDITAQVPALLEGQADGGEEEPNWPYS